MRTLATPFLLAILLISTTAVGQHLGVNYSFYQAQGEFNKNIDESPKGPTLNYLVDLGKESPWSIGLEGGLAKYAKNEFTVLNESNELVDMYEENSFVTAHLLGQYKAFQTNNFVVYGEARTGVTAFFSKSRTINEQDNGDDKGCGFGKKGDLDIHGKAFNLGIGGGVKLNLSGIVRGDGAVHNKLWLTAGATTNAGTRANYRQAGEGETSLDAGSRRSLTNYTQMRFGLSYKLNLCCSHSCPISGAGSE